MLFFARLPTLLRNLVVLLALLCVRCSTLKPHDPHSFSRPGEPLVTHLDLSLRVDFETKSLHGEATWTVDNSVKASELVLDTRGLTIHKVSVESASASAGETTFRFGEEDPLLGRALVIDVPPDVQKVTIDYRTPPEAAALLWLDPEQTAEGRHPFLFTQSEAILARTWVPCQDSPGIRFTYNAEVTVSAPLTAVMSAKKEDPEELEGGKYRRYRFHMPQPIPSYLMALAVGDLRFQTISGRCGVYAEPPLVEKAADEFADVEMMMAAAEKLFGPYRWERYDILVLPASFPFGGMENPRLTFATPTIIAGDRSLVALIAHELAHSWSGNLVTNATWDDFWLNEGFTVYLEHRIMEELRGKEYDEMLAVLGRQDLLRDVEELGRESRDTWLKLDLAGRDPDDGMTQIAYEKGYLLLRLLEETCGRERWDAFLRQYFDAHAFQSMTTEGFIAYLRKNLVTADSGLDEKIRIDDWVYGPGLPTTAPRIQSRAFRKVEGEARKWLDGAPAKSLETEGWSTHEWLHFLRQLRGASLSTERLQDLDAAYHLTDSGNAEILCEWLLRAIAARYALAYPALEKFLLEVGRRKFLKPLYRALVKSPEGTEMARRIYAQARKGYHQISRGTIDEILGWQEGRP